MNQTAILFLLGVVVLGAIVGATEAPERSTEIFGFASVITVSLLNMLKLDSEGKKTAALKDTADKVHELVKGMAEEPK